MSSQPSSSKPKAPAYISSSGQPLSSLPISARINNLSNDVYNFLGLYFVSLLSLDPYRAAQNSRFNTRGPAGSTGSTNAGGTRQNGGAGLFSGTRLGGGSSGAAGPRGGGGGASRRVGTVDDVRGPECGSCG